MLLEIDDWRSVGDLQYRFNKCFPNLNLHFFDGKEARNPARGLAGNVSLANIRRVHHQGVLTIKSWYTKNDVEAMLRDQFGLWTKVVPAQEGLEFAQKDCGKQPLSALNQMAQVLVEKNALNPKSADELVHDW